MHANMHDALGATLMVRCVACCREELQLVEGLQLGEDSWLQVLYRCKCKKVPPRCATSAAPLVAACTCHGAMASCAAARAWSYCSACPAPAHSLYFRMRVNQLLPCRMCMAACSAGTMS